MQACASQKINLCPSLQTIDHPTETLGLRKWWFHLTRLCWNSNSKLVNRKIQFCDCPSPSDFGRHCTSADQELCCARLALQVLHDIFYIGSDGQNRKTVKRLRACVKLSSKSSKIKNPILESNRRCTPADRPMPWYSMWFEMYCLVKRKLLPMTRAS